MTWKKLTRVDFIVVHASATPEGMDIGAKEIEQWHLERGFSSIGYHDVIRRDGTREQGRPINRPGAHVRGFNHRSIGICLVGGTESDKKSPEQNYTHAQYETLEKVIREYKQRWPDAEVVGHRDLPNVNKACPSFDAVAWWESRN